ncbi:MAG: uracil-DNA glycosylase [Bacteroidia bacterium]|jgi:uracil-DNA glycosylase
MPNSIPLDSSWSTQLVDELSQPYYLRLHAFIKSQKAEDKTIYPPSDLIFAALNACPFEEVKVIVLGQDPYHGPNQANGLCFSVGQEVKIPPSLVNIYRELTDDLQLPSLQFGDLSSWARQGVLLLNATLTVEAQKAGSHQNKGWELFTDSIIEKLNDQCNNLVFMLWGGYAKKKGKRIDRTKHLVLESGHPSPLSANRGYWFGNKHFSKCNAYLSKHDKASVDWSVD